MPARRILIVDNDAGCQKLFARILQRAGYETITASLGIEGLRLAQAFCPDLVLLDLGLPAGANGLDVAARLKLNPATKSIPVICITGLTDPNALLRSGAREADAAAFLRKPCGAREILETVDKCLRSNRSNARPNLQRGAIGINLRERKVFIAGRLLEHVSPESFSLMCALAGSECGVTRDTLLEAGIVHGETRKSVDMAVSRLRRELGPRGRSLIETIPGGYRIAPDGSAAESHAGSGLNSKVSSRT